MEKIKYKDTKYSPSAWAIKTSGKWELYNSSDCYIGLVEFTGSYYRFKGERNTKEDQRFISFVLNTLNQVILRPEDHYVYLVFVDKGLRYIGKGFGDRFSHAISGTSHVWELNKAYFCDSVIEVLCYADKMDSKSALNLEDSLISLWANPELQNLYNIKSVNKQPNHFPDCTEEDLYNQCSHTLLGVKVAKDEEYESLVDWKEYSFYKSSIVVDCNRFSSYDC